MSTLKITTAGVNYKDAVFAGAEEQNITKFVFANVPNLLDTDPIDDNAVVPLAHVTHEQPVELLSRLDDNAVVISVAMGHEIGNFDFNWYGAIAELGDGSEVLISVVHTKLQSKTKTVGNNTGNYMVKSIVWRSNAIAASLNITLATLPWQVDGNAFVSVGEFNDQFKNFYITKNETAISNRKKVHIFMATADLQIPTDDGEALDLIIDQSVVLSDANKCRLLAPVGKKIIMKRVPYDSIDIQDINIRHTVYKNSNGDWKI